MNSKLTIQTLGLAAILLGACESDQEPATPESSVAITTDSAGRRVVTSRAPQLPVNAWIVEPDPLVVLGDEERPLHQVTTARRLPDGRVAVLQRNPPGVLLFDRSGEVVRTLVREGDGPGELRMPQHLVFVAPDTLWAWSGGYGPGWALDSTGSLVGERLFDLSRLRVIFGDTLFSESHHPLPTGDVVAIDPGRRSLRPAAPTSTGWTPPTGARESMPMLITREYRARNLFPLAGDGVPGVASGVRFAPALAVPVAHFAASAERFHMAYGGSFAVDVYALDGTHLHQIRKDAPAARWDDTTFERMRREWLDLYTAAWGADDAQQAWDALPDQRVFPPINGLVADRAGGVWVRESLHRWNVFDDAGTWLTSIDVPLHRIFEVGADYVLGVAKGRDDVETVVELFLLRTSTNF